MLVPAVQLSFPLTARPATPNNIHTPPGRHVFQHGPLVLGGRSLPGDGVPVAIPRDATLIHQGGALYAVQGTDAVLAPLDDAFRRPEAEVRTDRRQVLFTD